MTKVAFNIYEVIESIVVKHRRTVVSVVHLFQALVANYLAFMLRFEGRIPEVHVKQMLDYLPYLLLIRMVFYLHSGLYKHLWRYASVSDLIKILRTVAFGSIAFLLLVRTFFGDTAYPRSIYILDGLLLIIISGGSRLFVRVFREYLQSGYAGRRVLIIGAGDAGEMMVRDMRNNPKYAYEPIGFVDDDPYKKGLSIHGVPILGPMRGLRKIVRQYSPEEILICIPSADRKTIKEIYEQCKPLNLPIKTLPGMSDILHGKVSVSRLKPLSLEDLLQREQVQTDIKSVRDYIGGKRVLVTGAGGSIGSELCRQIMEYGPSSLVLFDRYENGLFEIDLELSGKKKNVKAVVGDILDASRLKWVFSEYRPEIVFHAAAHKHVPLMEGNPLEAVKNNVFGTRNLIEASAGHGVKSFVMISTDKAVNPANVMGATKRVAEFLAIGKNSTCDTRFTAVRFGNVLGSNGSVVHVFREQIKKGGPVTVTHPEIKRFFMLIPEAVQLVLIAASAGKGGEIFVLDMGEQIKIADFAENLIRLSGYIPHEDIKIEFTGLRPGEKLYEELFDRTEKMAPTFHDKLRVAVPEQPLPETMSALLAELERIVRDNAVDELAPVIRKIIPGFKT